MKTTTNILKMTGLIGLLASMAMTTPALAQTNSYRVDAHSTRSFNLNPCGRSVDFSAVGDGDTDLDFWIYDSSGRLVHSDEDGTDITYATLNRYTSGCQTYTLRVRNFGDVYNMMALSLD